MTRLSRHFGERIGLDLLTSAFIIATRTCHFFNLECSAMSLSIPRSKQPSTLNEAWFLTDQERPLYHRHGCCSLKKSSCHGGPGPWILAVASTLCASEIDATCRSKDAERAGSK
jgi:hypothetical protein